jgi:P-type Cu2+ transporter
MNKTATSVDCQHCRLPVPAGLIDSASEFQFCCSGCKSAYRLINDNGLDDFYSMVSDDAPRPGSVIDRNEHFEEFDREIFVSNFAKHRAGDIFEITLVLDGIHCAACIWLLEKLPQLVPGVIETKLNWARQTIQVSWDNSVVRLSQIARTSSQLGYYPHPVRSGDNEDYRVRENRRHLIRIGIAGATAGNNMLIALALYLSLWSQMGIGTTTMLRFASCLIGMFSLLGPGRVFLRGAWNALRTRTAHMDLPIALGLSVGGIAGLINTIRGAGEIYFDSLSVLIFLLLVGRWIQFRQQGRAADAIELLYRLTPKKARKLVDGELVDTFVDMVQLGDQLEVRAGEIIPVDGQITWGVTAVDESILTGESRPVKKHVDGELLAGTTNQTSTIRMRTTATGSNTRISKIVKLVEQASAEKPQIVQWANRIGAYFVSAIVLLALATLAAWLYWQPEMAVDRSVALLIVACPCALAIATPLTISVALGRAASKKMMIKSGDVLQALYQEGMLWLDKTGTLTAGNLEVVQWHGRQDIAAVIAVVEAKSNHPVAEALLRYLQVDPVTLSIFECTEFTEFFGKGVTARVQSSEIAIGNMALMQDMQIDITALDLQMFNSILRRELSPCWIAVDGTVAAIVAMGDQLRSDSLECVEQLKSSGWEIGILSGDHQSIVDQVALRLGIKSELAIGQLSPEQKVSYVRNSMNQFPTVMMVGDGVNDSAALAAATVGIAVHGGAEASLAAAPVFLGEQGLSPILRLISISRSAGKTLRWNFAIAIGYNMVGASLAFLGLINPLVAAILMPISSLSVVAMSINAGKSSKIYKPKSRIRNK